MKILFRLLLAAMVCASGHSPTFAKDPATVSEGNLQRLLRDASLAVLKEGNARYLAGKQQHPNLDAERRASTVANGQEPVATVLSCSDSRVPVELIFDRGVGDLFVVRVAGNIAGESELATVEYGVDHLGTPVLLVMGHTKCGAVTAVVKGTELHGHLHVLAEQIKPAAAKARETANGIEATISATIEANVWLTIENILKKSALIRDRAKTGKVHVVGAIYDLESGRVNWLGTHPTQEEILNGTHSEDPISQHPATQPAPVKPGAAVAHVEPEANNATELAPFPKRPASDPLERNQPGRVNSMVADQPAFIKPKPH